MKEEGYVAIRRNIGGEWMDMASFSGDLEAAKHKAQSVDCKIPMWSVANPVVRMQKVVVTPVAD